MNSLIKSIVILVVLTGIESLSVDYNLYECKDVVKTNHTALLLGQCFDAKWKKYSGCSVTEFGCIISRLIKRDCTLNTAATTLIRALKDSAIKACDVEKLSNETADSYYRRVCPQLVNIREPNEVCRAFMPCNDLPSQIGVFAAKYGDPTASVGIQTTASADIQTTASVGIQTTASPAIESTVSDYIEPSIPPDIQSTESPQKSNSVRNSVQILIILSIVAILFIAIH